MNHVIDYGEEDLHITERGCPCGPVVLGDFTMHLSWEDWAPKSSGLNTVYCTRCGSGPWLNTGLDTGYVKMSITKRFLAPLHFFLDIRLALCFP